MIRLIKSSSQHFRSWYIDNFRSMVQTGNQFYNTSNMASPSLLKTSMIKNTLFVFFLLVELNLLLRWGKLTNFLKFNECKLTDVLELNQCDNINQCKKNYCRCWAKVPSYFWEYIIERNLSEKQRIAILFLLPSFYYGRDSLYGCFFALDTAFMYIIGILGCLRLYQSRHQDLIVNAHFAYAGLALIIFVAVLGVVSITVNYVNFTS